MMATQMGRPTRQTGDMLPLLERHAIQVLLKAGHDLSDVAKHTGASVDAVRRVRKEPAVEHVDDAAEHRARRIGRPSKTTPLADKSMNLTGVRPDPRLCRGQAPAGYRQGVRQTSRPSGTAL